MAAKPFGLPQFEAVLRSVQDWAAAYPDFARFLASGVPQWQALANWGGQLLREDRIAEAIEAFRSALTLAPEDPLLWTNLGLAYDRANAPLEAVPCLERSLHLNPGQPETWLLLGIAKKKSGDLTGAEADCRTAIEKGVASALAWQCLALIKQEQGEYVAATEAFLKCAEVGGADDAIHANLGRLHYQTGRIPEAAASYAEAARLDPANLHYLRMLRRVRFVNDALRGVPMDEVENVFRNSPVPADDDPQAELHDVLGKTFGHLSGFGHIAAAARVGRRLLELCPSATTEYLLKAVSGDSELLRTPPDVVVEQFDSFAEGFDAQLVERLRYDVPAKITALLADVLDSALRYDILDAGCGTGLCAPSLKPLARRLVGVDLSPKMLQRAEERGLYDALVCEDLVRFLESSPDRFDIIVAADVLNYFGDLRPVFGAAVVALRRGGFLAMSTELGSDDGFRILRSGRFAHSVDYVRACARDAFVERAGLETTMRLEANEPVRGNLFLFRRI